jgi:chemotaxis protein MotB
MAHKKKHHEEEHENHERWLVSYADFMTLLFAFFVVMYSVSRIDNKRLTVAANAIKWALHNAGTGGNNQLPLFDGPISEPGCVANVSTSPRPSDNMKIRVEAIETIRRQIEQRLKPFLLEQTSPGAVVIQIEDGRRINIRLAASQFFDPGLAALRPQIVPMLDAIAGELIPLQRPLRVEGHTDDQPVQGSRFRNNWELSAARAAAVTDYLQEAHRASPQLLSAVGLSSAHPIASGHTPEGRDANRRIELVLEALNSDELPRR